MKSSLVRFLAACALAVGLSPAAQAAHTPDKLDGVKIVTAEQVRDLQAKGAPVVDTRVAAEFAEKTIKGAVSVPYKEKSAKDVGASITTTTVAMATILIAVTKPRPEAHRAL